MNKEHWSIREKMEAAAVEELRAITSEFNSRLNKWHGEHGLVANFQWRYGRDEESAKSLEVLTVDRIVYRTPPPSPQQLSRLINDDEEPQRG